MTCTKCGETFQNGKFCPVCGGEGVSEPHVALEQLDKGSKEYKAALNQERSQYLELRYGLKKRHFVIAWLTLAMGIAVLLTDPFASGGRMSELSFMACIFSIYIPLNCVICRDSLWRWQKKRLSLGFNGTEKLEPTDYANGLNKFFLWACFLTDLGILIYKVGLL